MRLRWEDEELSRTTTELHTGQIRREVDPRLNREVEILGFPSGFSEDYVLIRTVGVKSKKGRLARRDRFNGKRGGYELVSYE